MIQLSPQELYPKLFSNPTQLPPYNLNLYNKTTINTLFSPFKVSLLHLAVIKGDYQMAFDTLQKGANPNLRDYRDYTPMHHAALKGDLIMLEFLKFFGGNLELKTQFNGTVIDLLILNRTYPDDPLKIYEEQDGKTSEISTERFKAITNGAIPSKRMYAKKETLTHYWEAESLGKTSTKEQLEAAEKASHLSYRLILKKFDLPNGKFTYGIVCNENIKSGENVGLYIGEFLKNRKTSDKDYLFETVSAEKYRGIVGMINDGLPNLDNRVVYNFLGLPSITHFYALEDIKKGDQLLYDYSSNHGVKYGNHVEFRLPHLIDFFQKNPLKNYLAFFKGSNHLSTFDSLSKAMHMMGYFLYIFQTPTTLMELTAHNLISYDDLLPLLQENFFKTKVLGSSRLCLMSYFHALKILKLKSQLKHNTNQNISKVSKKLIETYRHYGQDSNLSKMCIYFANAWIWLEHLQDHPYLDKDLDLSSNEHYLFATKSPEEAKNVVRGKIEKLYPNFSNVFAF